MSDTITVSGAAVHNLQNVSVALPRGKLVVMTGVSGSGKSSLAFDTIFAEGQRRYVESLSAYARQFLQVMDKPDVDSIDGLSPTISIDQKSASHNPRSTVGTVTEIHDYLRLLYARIGRPHCPRHNLPLRAQTPARVVDFMLSELAGARVAVLAPIVVDRRGEYLDLFRDITGKGFARVRVDGKIYDAEDVPPLAKTVKHTIELVIDRLRPQKSARQRLMEAVEAGREHGGGRLHILNLDDGKGGVNIFSLRHSCPKCGYAPPELEPKLFSFNNPKSACANCDGLGFESRFDPGLIIRHPELSLAGGAIRGWDRRNPYYFALLRSLAMHYKFDVETPYSKLSREVRNVILHGSKGEEIAFTMPGEKRIRREVFGGVISDMERRWQTTDSSLVREELSACRTTRLCSACKGARLSPDALAVKVGGCGIHELAQMPLLTLSAFFDSLELDKTETAIARRIVREIRDRAGFLVNVGLDYLSLGRAANTLSGGESQRIRLASQVGSGLTGVTYVLDEPSIGLHQHDNARLLDTLRRLRDLQNTVIVVEHDEEAIRAADFVVDMGPGAGQNGGKIVATGTPKAIANNKNSLTGDYLSGRRRIEMPKKRRKAGGDYLVVRGARGNNLKGGDFAFPLGCLVCVTGVSGSGKSTLVSDILVRAVWRHLHGGGEEPLQHKKLDGVKHIEKAVVVDQSPIGRTPRSNPATYTGLFTPVREWFAGLPLAKERGYAPGRFSFNVAGGRCENCDGDGVMRVEMHFLPDVFVKCETCGGDRYNRETLEVRYKGKNIKDVLDLTVDDALGFFAPLPMVARRLRTLRDVGLGYIRLGQAATTLSGGEAQRVKLSQELSKTGGGKSLYVLDEPTTGLHFYDVELLLGVLQRLTAEGNTVVVIEHHLDVIKSADWILDLGPKGGEGGGKLIAEGTPEQVARNKASLTGGHLQPLLKKRA
ncbi:MAG: excinuclease ABC subunit UvrA [Gammaproteobacteria bacterium]